MLADIPLDAEYYEKMGWQLCSLLYASIFHFEVAGGKCYVISVQIFSYFHNTATQLLVQSNR